MKQAYNLCLFGQTVVNLFGKRNQKDRRRGKCGAAHKKNGRCDPKKKIPSNRVRVFASAMRKREEETVSVKKKQHKNKQTKSPNSRTVAMAQRNERENADAKSAASCVPAVRGTELSNRQRVLPGVRYVVQNSVKSRANADYANPDGRTCGPWLIYRCVCLHYWCSRDALFIAGCCIASRSSCSPKR